MRGRALPQGSEGGGGLGQSLRPRGYEVTKCMSGREALELVGSRGFLPDLILLDCVMPTMDGSASPPASTSTLGPCCLSRGAAGGGAGVGAGCRRRGAGGVAGTRRIKLVIEECTAEKACMQQS